MQSVQGATLTPNEENMRLRSADDTTTPQLSQMMVGEKESCIAAETVITMPAEEQVLPTDYDVNPASLLTMQQQAIRVIVYLLVGFFLLANALNYTNGRMPDPATHPTLPDIGFDITPKYDIEPLTNVCVAILNVLNVFTVYKFILHNLGRPILPIFPQAILDNVVGKFLLCPPELDLHPQKFLEQFIRFAATYGTMLYLRCVIITVTVLPATDNHCKHPKPIEDWWHNVMMTMVTMGGGSIHCGDLLFSGHMTIISASMLSIVFYGRHINKFLPPLAILAFLASWFTIISSRSHYTDDIVVAFSLTSLFYAVFWMAGESPEPARLESIRGAPLFLQCIMAPVKGYKYLFGKTA